MPNYEEIYGGEFMAAKDLQDEIEAEIEAIEVLDIGDRQKIVATLKGQKKKFVLNKTNAKRISEATGNKDYTKWAGAKIKLYKIFTTFGKEEVEAIRVKSAEEKSETEKSEVK